MTIEIIEANRYAFAVELNRDEIKAIRLRPAIICTHFQKKKKKAYGSSSVPPNYLSITKTNPQIN